MENENAILFQFREIGNEATSFRPEFSHNSNGVWHETNVVGDRIKEVKTLMINPLESKFFKYSWSKDK